jgi:hypothetical protein
MAEHEEHDLNQSPELNRPQGKLRLFSWWWVWIPVIVVVILWLGGWGFGDYGGPWSPRPQNVQQQISDTEIAIVGGQGTFTLNFFSIPS